MAETLTIQTLEDWARAGAHRRVLHHGERRAIVYLNGVASDLDLTTNGGSGDH